MLIADQLNVISVDTDLESLLISKLFSVHDAISSPLSQSYLYVLFSLRLEV